MIPTKPFKKFLSTLLIGLILVQNSIPSFAKYPADFCELETLHNSSSASSSLGFQPPLEPSFPFIDKPLKSHNYTCFLNCLLPQSTYDYLRIDDLDIFTLKWIDFSILFIAVLSIHAAAVLLFSLAFVDSPTTIQTARDHGLPYIDNQQLMRALAQLPQ